MDGTHSTRRARERWVLWEALGWTVAAFVLEIGIGWCHAGSVALLSDAGHVAHHFAAIFTGLLAYSLGERSASAESQARIESLGTLLIGLLLLAAAPLILWESWKRYRHLEDIHGEWMLLTAVLGGAANLRVLWILRRVSGQMIKGIALHAFWDLVSSAVVIGCSVLVAQAGMIQADPIGGLVVGAGIIFSAAHLLMESFHRHAKIPH